VVIVKPTKQTTGDKMKTQDVVAIAGLIFAVLGYIALKTSGAM
tara:strand:- start:132 stop:260 length:129 start_codon:yes stop_codon:yes gene_type:complete